MEGVPPNPVTGPALGEVEEVPQPRLGVASGAAQWAVSILRSSRRTFLCIHICI